MTTHGIGRWAGLAGGAVGALSIVESSRVLLGVTDPSYTVLRPLVAYNLILGGVAILAAIGIWFNRRWAGRLSIGITVCHLAVLVLLLLFAATGGAVAHQSILAMVFRSLLWITVVWLLRRGRWVSP